MAFQTQNTKPGRLARIGREIASHCFQVPIFRKARVHKEVPQGVLRRMDGHPQTLKCLDTGQDLF